MSQEEKQLLERINSYCSYGVLVVTICFCALIYWGNRQLMETNYHPNAQHEQQVNNAKVMMVKHTSSTTTTNQ